MWRQEVKVQLHADATNKVTEYNHQVLVVGHHQLLTNLQFLGKLVHALDNSGTAATTCQFLESSGAVTTSSHDAWSVGQGMGHMTEPKDMGQGHTM